MTAAPRNKPTLETMVVAGIMVVAMLAYFLALRQSPTLIFGLGILVILTVILFTRPTYGLAALLVVRPIVDSIGDYRITVGTVGVNVAGALSLLAIAWSIWILITRRARIWKYELFWPIAIFTLVSLASLTYTWDRTATLTELLRISGFFLLYFVARTMIADWPSFRRISLALVASLAIPTLVGFWQVLTGTGITFADSYNRAYGTFGTPNVLAFYLVLGITFFLVSWPMLQTRLRSRWPLIIVLGLLLMLTFTRGGWAGLLLAVAVIAARRYRRMLVGGLVALVVIIAVLPSINIVTVDVFGFDLAKVPGVQEIITRGSNLSSYQWRLDVWTEMSSRFQERPLQGFGLGAFPAIRQLQVADFFQGVGAHNDYLRLIIELGVIGVGTYTILLIGIFYYLNRADRRLGLHPLSFPVVAMIGFTAAFVLMSVFDNLLQSTPVMWAYLIMLGAVLNLTPQVQKNRPVAKKK